MPFHRGNKVDFSTFRQTFSRTEKLESARWGTNHAIVTKLNLYFLGKRELT